MHENIDEIVHDQTNVNHVLKLNQKDAKSKRKWIIKRYDTISYEEALKIQEEFHKDAMISKNQYLMLLQHHHVITLGRRTEESHLLLSKEELDAKGIDLFKVDRGGSATYHGPGQLVGYIITKSTRYGGIHKLVSSVLEMINSVIKRLSIDSMIDYDNPGIWTNTKPPRKLSAVGMSNKLGYTMHGFAINVDLPLTGFTAIIPCGLSLPVSTLAIETGNRFTVNEIADMIENEFTKIFT